VCGTQLLTLPQHMHTWEMSSVSCAMYNACVGDKGGGVMSWLMFWRTASARGLGPEGSKRRLHRSARAVLWLVWPVSAL
jgi:hypothetical protein